MIHMRPFTDLEIRNMEFLVDKSVKFTQVQITSTGLKKSILDATDPMRTFFFEEGIHDYSVQLQGTTNKVMLPCVILGKHEKFDTRISLYRPETKKGDPRLWIYGLKDYTDADDIHVIFHIDRLLFVINMTKINIRECFENPLINPIQECIMEINNRAETISSELLRELRKLSGVWHKTIGSGNTAVGRTVEHLLGLGYNPKAEPDYKGIELKSKRVQSAKSMYTIFGSFPDWDISSMTREQLILQYGHVYHDGIRRVFSTVAKHNKNNDNFFLNINENSAMLELLRDEEAIRNIVVWRMQKVHDALLKKHKETFWIDVYSEMSDGTEYMKLKKVDHTKSPNVAQFDVLLEQSIINLDICVGREKTLPNGKRTGADNWNFRISKKHRNLLFPQVAEYSLEV